MLKDTPKCRSECLKRKTGFLCVFVSLWLKSVQNDCENLEKLGKKGGKTLAFWMECAIVESWNH